MPTVEQARELSRLAPSRTRPHARQAAKSAPKTNLFKLFIRKFTLKTDAFYEPNNAIPLRSLKFFRFWTG
jgi:hypothetical protein